MDKMKPLIVETLFVYNMQWKAAIICLMVDGGCLCPSLCISGYTIQQTIAVISNA